MGVTGFRSPQAPSCRSPEPHTEVRGRLWQEGEKKRTNKALEFWRSRHHSRNSDKEGSGPRTPQSGRKVDPKKQLRLDRFFTQERKEERKYKENVLIGLNSKKTSEEPEESAQEQEKSQGK